MNWSNAAQGPHPGKRSALRESWNTLDCGPNGGTVVCNVYHVQSFPIVTGYLRLVRRFLSFCLFLQITMLLWMTGG